MINLHERMLPTSAGVEAETSLSPVGRRIQLSHRGHGKELRYLNTKGKYGKVTNTEIKWSIISKLVMIIILWNLSIN